MTRLRPPRQRGIDDEAEDRRQIWKWREDVSEAINRLGGLTGTLRNILGAGTTVVKTGAGTLLRLIVNAATGTSLAVYDNTAAVGTPLFTLTPSSVVSLAIMAEFSTGLTVVATGAVDITVAYE